MNLNTLLKLYNDLTQLSKEIPIVVLYDSSMGIIFRQYGKVVSIPYLRSYYFSKPKLKLGVLTSTGYVELMKSLQKLIEDPEIKEGNFGMLMGSYCTKFYRYYPNVRLDNPQLFAEINLVTIKRKWLSKLYLKIIGDPETKILLKGILHEERNRKSKKFL